MFAFYAETNGAAFTARHCFEGHWADVKIEKYAELLSCFHTKLYSHAQTFCTEKVYGYRLLCQISQFRVFFFFFFLVFMFVFQYQVFSERLSMAVTNFLKTMSA